MKLFLKFEDYYIPKADITCDVTSSLFPIRKRAHRLMIKYVMASRTLEHACDFRAIHLMRNRIVLDLANPVHNTCRVAARRGAARCGSYREYVVRRTAPLPAASDRIGFYLKRYSAAHCGRYYEPSFICRLLAVEDPQLQKAIEICHVEEMSSA